MSLPIENAQLVGVSTVLTKTEIPAGQGLSYDIGFKDFGINLTGISSLHVFREINHVIYSHFKPFRETLYIRAIRNLVKQKEFLSLMYQLSTDQITEDELNEELDQNSSKYVIDVKDAFSDEEIAQISQICSLLNIELSTDDISEMFGIYAANIEKYAASQGLLTENS